MTYSHVSPFALSPYGAKQEPAVLTAVSASRNVARLPNANETDRARAEAEARRAERPGEAHCDFRWPRWPDGAGLVLLPLRGIGEFLKSRPFRALVDGERGPEKGSVS